MDVKNFLTKHKLENYWNKFDETGNDNLEKLQTLSHSELHGVLKNDINMKDGHIRKFLNALVILKSGEKRVSHPPSLYPCPKVSKMPEKVESLLIPNP